jgi:hypothetical protein
MNWAGGHSMRSAMYVGTNLLLTSVAICAFVGHRINIVANHEPRLSVNVDKHQADSPRHVSFILWGRIMVKREVETSELKRDVLRSGAHLG